MLLIPSLSFSQEVDGQTAKVAIINLDSLRNQSFMMDWEKALWEEGAWEIRGKKLIDTLQKKYQRLQRFMERSCLTSEALAKIQAELEKDLEEILILDGKYRAAKKIFPVEIDNFVRQQFMILMPKAKLNMEAAFLSTSKPMFMEEEWADKLVDATPWFAAEFKNNPRIFDDWLAFRKYLIETVEKGNWK